MEEIQKNKRVQLTCPKCKYEFPFNLGKTDEDLMKIGKEIQNINKQLASYNKLSIKQPEQIAWRERAVLKLGYLHKEYADLKAKSKVVHEKLNEYSYKILKDIIKDFYGEKEFIRCINELVEREKAYTLDSAMNLDYYTHKKGSVIQKV